MKKINRPFEFILGLTFCIGLFSIAGFVSYGGNLTQDITPLLFSQPHSVGNNLTFQKPDQNGKKIPFNAIPSTSSSILPFETGQPTSPAIIATEQSAAQNNTPGTLPTPPNNSANSKVMIGNVNGRLLLPDNTQLPANLPVTLFAFENSTMQKVWSAASTISADGTFFFSQVAMPSNWAFQTRVTIDGVDFSSKLQAAFLSNDLYLPITVYETSTDPSIITIDRLHIFINNTQTNQLEITEIFILSNTSNKVIISANRQPILQFGLPQNATDLKIQGGAIGDGRYIHTSYGFGDLRAIFPGRGQTEELFTYNVPYNSSALLKLPIYWPVTSTLIMVQGNSMAVSGQQIGNYRQQLFEGRNFKVYDATDLAKGSTLSIEVADKLPNGRDNSLTPISHLLVGAGTLLVVLLIIGVYLLRNFYKSAKNRKSESQPEDINTLIDSIIVLDNLHKAGKISPAAYLQRRQALKREVLMRVDPHKAASQG